MFTFVQVFTLALQSAMAFLLIFITLLHLVSLAMLFVATLEKVRSECRTCVFPHLDTRCHCSAPYLCLPAVLVGLDRFRNH